MSGPTIAWGTRRSWQRKGNRRGLLPVGARRLCQRCRAVDFKATRGRRFCGGCSRNDHTRRRWRKAGGREIY